MRSTTDSCKRNGWFLLIGGIGEPDDIARVAVFLASDDARYVNGETITVDGGWYATNYLGGLGFNMPPTQ